MRKFSREFFTMVFEIIIGGFWSLVLIGVGVAIWLCLYGIVRAFTMQ